MEDRPVKQTDVLVGAIGIVAILAAGFLITGCEEGDPDRWLTVSPAEVVLQGGSNTVTFTANASSNSGVNFSSPIEWTMSTPRLGAFVGGAGNSIIYARTVQNGINVITAEDPYGAQGSAVVTQR